MASIVQQLNIGALVVPVPSVAPQSASAGTINGASIDRFAHGEALSGVLFLNVGAVSGAPSTTTIYAKVQHSADNSTWSDYTPGASSSVAQTSNVTAANNNQALAVNLSSANRYIRAVAVTAFTGGTSPAALLSASVMLGGEQALPAT